MQSLQLKLPAQIEFSAMVRNMAEEVFILSGFSPSWARRLKLVLDELFMNAVLHGSSAPSQKVRLGFTYNDHELSVSVEDEGRFGETPDIAALNERFKSDLSDFDQTNTSGRGLSLITRQWADEVLATKSEHGGVKIMFTKAIDAREVEAPKPAHAVFAAPTLVIQLSGEIDATNFDLKVAPILTAIPTMPAKAILELDFKEVSYVNSTFIGYLAKWHYQLKNHQGAIRIAHCPKPILDVLSVIGLDRIIDITPLP